MLDRKDMISLESGLESIDRGARFMPFELIPERKDGSAPDRLLWVEFGDQAFSSPFTDQELVEQAPGIRWFASRIEDVDRVNHHLDPVPLRGVVMHMSRCGSTLGRMLLGQVKDAFVLSEPRIVNSTITGSAASRLATIMRAVLAGKSGPFGSAYLKCTSWNVLHGEVLLDALDAPPAIFLHRDPTEVLVSHHLAVANHDPRYRVAPPRGVDPDPAANLARLLEAAFELEDDGRLRFVAYEDIIDRFIDGDLPDHLGYVVDAETRSRMLAVADMDSKQPDRKFRPDRDEKRSFATKNPAIRNAAAELADLHAEACRRSAWAHPGNRDSRSRDRPATPKRRGSV